MVSFVCVSCELIYIYVSFIKEEEEEEEEEDRVWSKMGV